jgi:hypothetical protein
MLVVGLAVLEVASNKDSEVCVVMASFETGSTLKNAAESGGIASSSLSRVKVMETPLSAEFDATNINETGVGFGNRFFALHPEEEENPEKIVKVHQRVFNDAKQGKPRKIPPSNEQV